MTVAKASKAPAAPIMWPVIDFVPLMANEPRAPPGAPDLGIDPRPAGIGQLEVLEEETAGALAQDEAVAGRVERSRDGLEGLPRPGRAASPHCCGAGVGRSGDGEL